MARWAMNEAAAQVRKGLEFLPAIPDEVLRKERELELQIMLGQVLVATKGYGADEPAQTYVHILQMNGDSYRLNQSKRRSHRASSDTSVDNPAQA
jgi:hypothetical protein